LFEIFQFCVWNLLLTIFFLCFFTISANIRSTTARNRHKMTVNFVTARIWYFDKILAVQLSQDKWNNLSTNPNCICLCIEFLCVGKLSITALSLTIFFFKLQNSAIEWCSQDKSSLDRHGERVYGSNKLEQDDVEVPCPQCRHLYGICRLYWLFASHAAVLDQRACICQFWHPYNWLQARGTNCHLSVEKEKQKHHVSWIEATFYAKKCTSPLFLLPLHHFSFLRPSSPFFHL